MIILKWLDACGGLGAESCDGGQENKNGSYLALYNILLLYFPEREGYVICRA